ncbi:acyl-CoA reductase-like NAD-dependent aldehyde dehydrogenase [Bradyrhizobium sp. CIR18]|uniref:aldehyde dehydrogenase family protein n=1 Tax=Bradyrhizobium sp. CIR18 TaxID=2663839 RepID=UPI00180B06E6|nr:aldehyde dehydrogenase family protein [Bradyrhizobium sp. CIR18]MBB4363081.1 acyl-CoA reductase-like NAD-dependent aldehyde dehydrogenase [Bradyrhizobium sp. CIR18]
MEADRRPACYAASRIFIRAFLWPSLKTVLCDEIATIKVGEVADFGNFMGAVIDERAWRKHMRIFEEVKSSNAKILTGGRGDDKTGYFVAPTLIETDDLDRECFVRSFSDQSWRPTSIATASLNLFWRR